MASEALAGILVQVAALTLAVEFLARRLLGPRQAIGDEVEYLFRARSSAPLVHEPFLRVPLYPAFLWLVGRRLGERGIDLALILVAVVSTTTAAAAGGLLFGDVVAAVTGVMLALCPDRWVLSRRLWPDTLLALHASLLLYFLVAARLQAGAAAGISPVMFWILGGLVAAATLVRIDALVLGFAVTLLAPRAGWFPRLSLLGLAFAGLVLAAVFNGRRFRRWLPDDTFLFNLRLMVEDRSGKPLEPTMIRLGSAWRSEDASARGRLTGQALRAGLRRPWVAVLAFARRGWSLTGADTFAIEKLVAPDSSAFPGMKPLVRRVVSTALRAGFPLLLALSCASLTVANEWLHRPDLWLAGAILLPAMLFTARTRYRFAALFCLAPGAGVSVATLAVGAAESRVIVLVVALVLLSLFLKAPRRAESW